MCAAVDEALASSGTLREWSVTARRRVEEGFRIEDEAAALNQLYRELLEEEGGRGWCHRPGAAGPCLLLRPAGPIGTARGISRPIVA